MRRRGGMEGISALVNRVYPRKEPEDNAAVRAYVWWARAVSPRVLRCALPVRFNRGVMTIHTTSSAWANSLQLESDSLLASIRSRTPDCGVRRLVFRIGALPDIAVPMEPMPEPKPVIPLSKLPDEVGRELARIRDDQLRDTVARAVAVGLGAQADD